MNEEVEKEIEKAFEMLEKMLKNGVHVSVDKFNDIASTILANRESKQIEIKKLLNCGYYDECHNYIVELNEEKMKDFFKVFFKADTIIFNNNDMNKLQEENQKLQEKMDYMMEVHRKECEEMKCYVDKMAHEADQKTYKILDEQEKRYMEIKENGRTLIKAIAKYI